MSDPHSLFTDVQIRARESRLALAKIGEGDWTPQDTCHFRLVLAVERLTAEPVTRADPEPRLPEMEIEDGFGI